MIASSYTLEHALNVIPNYLHDRVHAIAATLDIDPGMALSTMLSGMAAGVHGGFKVERPDGGMELLALFSIVLSGPTTGKTRTHKLVHKAHNAEDIRRYMAYEEARSGTGDVGGRGNSSEVGSAAGRRSRPRLRSVILQDTTKRGLLEAERGVGEAASISVHEGQNVLGTALFRSNFDTLNLLYDGEGKTMLTRAKGDIVMAFDASLNLLVMVQPDVFERYLQKYGDMARGVGFLARCLFTSVPVGGCMRSQPCRDADQHLAAYNEQVRGFLEAQVANLEAGNTERQVLSFSPEACESWWQLKQEQDRLTQTMYWHVQDAANRALQNVARVAAVIHCYNGSQGPINRETLYAAWAIVQWHMSEFTQLFPPKAPPPPKPPKLSTREKQQQREYDDARIILDRIAEICWRTGEPAALKSKVLVRSGLYNARFRTAVMRLIDEGRVLESGEGHQLRLSINPQSHSTPFSQSGWAFSTGSSL